MDEKRGQGEESGTNTQKGKRFSGCDGGKRPPVLSFRGAQKPRARASFFFLLPYSESSLTTAIHYPTPLPTIKALNSLSLFSLLCFEITLLSFSQLLPYLPPRRSSRSFSQTLLSTFDSASSCVPISSRISWIYRNRVKPPSTLGFCVGDKKINVCEAFEEVMVVKLLIQDDKLRFDSLNNRGRGGSVVLECGTLRCICCCYFSFFILPYALV